MITELFSCNKKTIKNFHCAYVDMHVFTLSKSDVVNIFPSSDVKQVDIAAVSFFFITYVE